MNPDTIAAEIESPPTPKGFPFYLVLLGLVFEYSRPQDLLPGLAVLRLPLILHLLLLLVVVLSGRLLLTDKQTKLFLLFLALMVPHVPLATNNYWALWTLYDMVAIFIMYLGITTFVTSLPHIRTLISVWLGIHLFLAIYGIWTGGQGVGGFLGDENDFAVATNMAIPYAFFLISPTQGRFKKAALFALVALLAFATIATNSRGGFLGLVAVGAYCWLLSAKKIASGILVGLLIVLTVNFAPDTYVAKIRTIWEEGTEHETAGDRMYEWKIGWRMFLDNPIAGVGQNNFPWRFEMYEGADKYRGMSRAGRAAHSLYFTLLPELGLIGTTIFLLLLWTTVKDIVLLRRSCTTTMGADPSEQSPSQRVYATASAIGGGLVGYLVTSAFVSTLYYPCYWYTVGFSLALKKAYLSEIGADIPEDDPQPPEK